MKHFFMLCALCVGLLPAGAQKQIIVEGNPDSPRDSLRMVPPVGHTKMLSGAALTPDGRFAVTAARDESVRLWDTATGREARLLTGQDKPIAHLAVSPDGKFALTSSATDFLNPGDNTTIFLWDLQTGQKLREWETLQQKKLFWLPDNRRFLVVGGAPMEIWDSEKGSLGAFKPEDNRNPYPDDPGTADLSPDGKNVVTGGGEFLCVWDVETRRLTRVIRSEGTFDTAVTLAADGRIAASDGAGNVQLWNAAGQKLRTWKVSEDAILDAAGLQFSQAGLLLRAGTSNGEVLVWHANTGRLVQKWKAHTEGIVSLFEDSQGRLLTASEDQTARLWSAEGKLLQTFSGQTEIIGRMAFSPDGRHVLNIAKDASDGNWDKRSLRLWELVSGRALRVYRGLPGDVYYASFSADGKNLISGGGDKVQLWNRVSSVPQKSINADIQHSIADLSSDGKLILTGGKSGAHVFDAATGQTKLIFPKDPKLAGEILFAKFLPDGTQALTLQNIGKDDAWQVAARLWDTQNGTPVRSWDIPDPYQGEATLSPDGKWLAAGRFKVGLWNLATGKLANTLNEGGECSALAFSADSERLLIGFLDGKVQARQIETGELQTAYRAHSAIVHSLGYLQRLGKSDLIWSAAGDSTLRLVDAKTGREKLAYVTLKGGDWLAYTPDGRFDGSPGGISKVTFARGDQTFALEQFAERFYQPGLIALILNGPDEPDMPSAGTLLAQGTPPIVKITSPQNGTANASQIEVAVTASEQNKGGIKAIRLYHNGRLVGGPGNLRGIVVEAPPPVPADGTKTQKFTVTLAPGDNVLRAVAYSQTDLESHPDEVRLQFAAAQQKPALHVVAIGINKYRDATMDLTYARPDAASIAQFFEAKKQDPTLYSRINVTLLLDEAATGEAIRTALKSLGTQSKPEDVVLIYLAGHGETAPQSDAPDAPETFYFLPAEMRQMALQERVRQLGISRLEMDEMVKNITARKIVLVYDACKSGAAVGGMTTGTRGIANEAQALAQLARAQGIHILTASTAQQYAGEVRALGHGILTYALLEGLGGKAADSNSFIKVRELMSYVEDRVPELAKEYRGREQWPVPFNGGQNFPLIMQK